MRLLSLVCCLLSSSALIAAPTEAMQIFGEIQKTNRVANLRNNAWLSQNYQAALKVATNANEKARIAMAYAKFGYASAIDDDFAKWRQLQRDAYATPGADAALRLQLLKEGVAGLDYETDGWKLVEKESKLLQQTYFWELIDRTRIGTSGIEESGSAEHRLAVCEKAIATLGPGAMNGAFVSAKATTLLRLGRVDEAERTLQQRLRDAGDNPRLRYTAYESLTDFYRGRAKRYYAEPDPVALRKALVSGEAALAEMRKFDERPNGYFAPLAVAFELQDYAKVDELLVAYRACCEKRKLKFPDAWSAMWAGDLAFYRGQYAKAVEHYSSVKELPRAQSAESHYNRYIGALYALGRYDEALKLVPKLIAWCSLADRNALYKRILNQKIEAEKKEKK